MSNTETTTAPSLVNLPPKHDAQSPAQPVEDQRKRAAGGRWRTLNQFVDQTMASLPPASIPVWVCLFRNARPDGLVKMGQADLARRCGYTKKTIQRAINDLEERGLVDVLKRGNSIVGISEYRIRGVK